MAVPRTVVQLVVPVADVEQASDDLWQAGPSAVSEEEVGDGRVRLTADVSDLAAVPERWPATVLDADTDAHLDEWRRWARPVRAGRSLVLQPAWSEPAELRSGDLVVRLDPGRTFGSGSHPSTRLVAAALESHVAGGEAVLDVGSGSGVLGVVALLLGAATVTGVDVDGAAAAAATTNARLNDVGDRMRCVTGEVFAVDGRFDVVVANIGVRVLADVADAIEDRTRPGGLVVLAGLLDEQADATVARYPACRELERRHEDGWTAVVLRRL